MPAHAINSDSATFGRILSIASGLRSNGNIAPTNIAICSGAFKIFSSVISSPDADQIEPATINAVIVYFKIRCWIGCLGILIKFFFLTRH